MAAGRQRSMTTWHRCRRWTACCRASRLLLGQALTGVCPGSHKTCGWRLAGCLTWLWFLGSCCRQRVLLSTQLLRCLLNLQDLALLPLLLPLLQQAASMFRHRLGQQLLPSDALIGHLLPVLLLLLTMLVHAVVLSGLQLAAGAIPAAAAAAAAAAAEGQPRLGSVWVQLVLWVLVSEGV